MENKNDKIDELIDFCLSRAEIDCFTDEQFKIRETYYEIEAIMKAYKDGFRWKEEIKEKIDQIVKDRIRDLVQFDITCPYCGRKYSIEKLNAWPEEGRT